MTGHSEDTRLIRALRLRNQGLVQGSTDWRSAQDVANGMLAMQAQNVRAVRFALSLRAADAPTDQAVGQAMSDGSVVRNRPSRGTLQVTAAEDLQWLTALMSPRSNAAAQKRRDALRITQKMVDGVEEVLRQELADGQVATRQQLVDASEAAGVPLTGGQAGHILRHHTEMMTIVYADSDGAGDRFALPEAWIAESRSLEGEDALAELATRFFTARGPATSQCLSWWANLTMGDTRKAISGAGSSLQKLEIRDTDFIVPAGSAELSDTEVEATLATPLLLPAFDEYLLGYRHRNAVITKENAGRVVPGRNGMFKPLVVVDGEVVGVWSDKIRTDLVTITIEPFRPLTADEVEGLSVAVEGYGAFHQRTATLEVADTAR